MFTKFFTNRKKHLVKKSAQQAVHSAASAAIESLEGRKLFAATAPSFIAIADGGQNFGDTRRAIAYYDVSDVNGTAAGNFADTPDLVIWTGYEITVTTGGAAGRNFEEISGLDVNRSNGDTYVLSFDSGPVGVADPVGDTQGDYDLYRYNFGLAYSKLITTLDSRTGVGASGGKGVMMTDRFAPDGFDYQTAYGARSNGPTGLPAVSFADAGVPNGRDNTDADPTNDFLWIDGLVDKIGEVARVGGSATPFFDQQDIQYVDDQTILLMENTTGTGPSGVGGNTSTTLPSPGVVTDDYSIRTLERVSTSSGSASWTSPNTTGGFNGNTSESWESFAWTGDNYVNMDNFAVSGGLSEVDGMRYVEKDGARGVWVSDRDGGGDDFQFFNLNFGTRVATKDANLVFALDEDPSVSTTTNDGDVDTFDVDENGTLQIMESDFTTTPSALESRAFSLTATYGGSSALGTWTVHSRVNPTVDDDAVTTDTRFSVYERGQDRQYIFDTDSGASPGVIADSYVYDGTGTLVHQELNSVNMFLVENKIRSFTLGDFSQSQVGSLTSQDGIVDATDIDTYFARIADPTVGGRFSSGVGNSMFDLDGDDTLAVGDPFGFGTITGDMDYLIRRVLGTDYGDANLDGVIDQADQDELDLGLLAGSGGWANGNFNGDPVIDQDDQDILDAARLVYTNPPNPTRI